MDDVPVSSRSQSLEGSEPDGEACSSYQDVVSPHQTGQPFDQSGIVSLHQDEVVPHVQDVVVSPHQEAGHHDVASPYQTGVPYDQSGSLFPHQDEVVLHDQDAVVSPHQEVEHHENAASPYQAGQPHVQANIVSPHQDEVVPHNQDGVVSPHQDVELQDGENTNSNMQLFGQLMRKPTGYQVFGTN